MNKSSSNTLLYGAIIGAIVGAVLGALMASRSSGHEGKRPTATEATAIGMTSLGLVKQLVDAFA